MKSRRIPFAIIVIISIVGLTYFFVGYKPKMIYQKSISTSNQRIEKNDEEAEVKTRGIEAPERQNKGSIISEISPTSDELKIMAKSSVEFYGQILDQHDKPVKDANIICSWPNMNPMGSPITVVSNTDGKFEIKNLKAMGISILINPPNGYGRITDASVSASEYIQIAESPDRIRLSEAYKTISDDIKSSLLVAEPYKPNKDKPKIFRLNSLGLADSLYTTDQNDSDKHYGTTRYFSLKNPKTGNTERPEGEYCIATLYNINKEERDASKRDWKSNKQWSWSFKISVPGGGIQIIPGDHNRSLPEQIFKGKEVAPVSGYQDAILFEFPKNMDATKWNKLINTGCYIRFKDGTYARATVFADDDLISIKSYYNPTGSSNLLYDHSKRIEE